MAANAFDFKQPRLIRIGQKLYDFGAGELRNVERGCQRKVRVACLIL